MEKYEIRLCERPTLDELREKEDNIHRDKYDGIRTDAKNVTLNDLYDLWKTMKKGVKDKNISGISLYMGTVCQG